MPVLTPNYGSTLSFSVSYREMANNDGYTWRTCDGTNHIYANFDINLKNLTVEEANEVVDTLKSFSGEAYFDFQDRTNFFKDMDFSFDEASFELKSKNYYDAFVKFSQRNESPELSLIDKMCQKEVKLYLGSGQQIYDGDVLYDESISNVVINKSGFGISNSTSENCFYYCIADHIATGDATGNLNLVQNKLPIQLEENFVYEFISSEAPLNFKSSFDQRINSSTILNKYIRPVNVKFDNLTDEKAKQLLYFCDRRAGGKTFHMESPTGIVLDGANFFLDGWEQTWNYKDSNTVSLKLRQDVKIKSIEYNSEIDDGALSPTLLYKPIYVFDANYYTGYTSGQRLSDVTAFSPTGEITNRTPLTNDFFYNSVISGRQYVERVTTTTGARTYNGVGGFDFGINGYDSEFSFVAAIKNDKQGLSTLGNFFGRELILNMTGNYVDVSFFGETQTAQTYTSGIDRWMYIMARGNEFGNLSSTSISTPFTIESGVNHATGSFDKTEDKINAFCPPHGAVDYLSATIFYFAAYKKFIPDEAVNGVFKKIHNRLHGL